MKKTKINNGFSLVEILVSLFVVSLAAVNISGLQKVLSDQNRNNFSHTTVIQLVSGKLEELMHYDELQDVLDLDGTSSIFTARGTEFTLSWGVENVFGAASTSPIREVSITVIWVDATGNLQTFAYTKQISFVMLLKGHGGGLGNTFQHTVPNLLGTNKVNYFESKVGYKIDSYVIYNSQLFQATSAHMLGSEDQREVAPPISYNEGVVKVSDGWDLKGDIDDKNLASLFID